MKKALLFLLLLFAGARILHAQEVIRPQSCDNPEILQQADSLKQIYLKDGFEVLREASITMENEYEMPVVVPMREGTFYQFVFVGDKTSRLYEVRVYDSDDKMVIYQKKTPLDGNIVAFSYIPKFTQMHMFKPVQVNKKKKKGLCGYVMLLRQTKKS